MSEASEQDEYYFLELFDTYEQASHRARQISSEYGGLARVKREDASFKVLVPLWVKNQILDPQSPPSDDDEEDDGDQKEEGDDYDPVDEEIQREREELLGEIYGNADNWNRSDQGGWFYSDDDETA